MNKIHINILFITAIMAFVGCVREEDDIFDKSAVERLDEIGATYSERLTAQGGTWIVELYPTNGFGFNKLEMQEGGYEVSMPTSQYDGVGFLLGLQFNNDGTVRVGMNNALTNQVAYQTNHYSFSGGETFNSLTQYKEMVSNWDIITDLGPVLSFSSYNDLFSIFSTPDEIKVSLKGQDKYSYTGNTGTGLGGDYEFVVIDLGKDATTAMLKGKKRGTYNRLTRLPEGTDFDAYFKDIDAFKTSHSPSNAKNDLCLTVDGVKYRVRGISSYMPNVYPYNGNAILSEDNHSYLITKRDGKYYMRFRSALGKGENKEQEFVYDEVNDEFHGLQNSHNTIVGLDPLTFFDESFKEFNAAQQPSYTWRLNRTNAMSDSFKALYTELQNQVKGLSGKTGNMGELTITSDQKNPDVLHINLNYSYKNANKQTVNAVARFDCSYSNNGTEFVMSDLQPVDNSTTTFQQSLSAVAPFFNALLGAHAVRSNVTKFYLNQLRLTSPQDADSWFVLECR
ncbi:MAG: DUF4302 domain-containing protein [Bacteroidaceae bacterium]|nr:DUF4302 domain-containing protein [Bacteroidaceae bacterium]